MRSTFASAVRIPDAKRVGGTLQPVALTVAASSLVLALIGALTIHSASSELAVQYLPRQLAWIGLGMVAMAVGFLVDYHLWLRLSTWFYGIGILAVGLILVFGHEAGGARSWIGIGGFGGQPLDAAKLATAFVLARYLGKVRYEYLDLRHIFAASLLSGIPMVLIALQPDYGGAAMFVPVLGGMLWVAGIRPRLIIATAVIALALGAGLWTFAMQDYQKERVLNFIDSERDPLGTGYQLRQSKIAVGSGSLLGRGYMQGTQSRLRFLPARHTDFVIAVLAEEQGFLGILVVFFFYILFLGGGARIALRARDRSGMLLAAGLLAALAVHVLYNTAMVIGFLPVTGIPLPFLSYGGSFTLFCFFATGILLGIDSRRYVNL